MVDPDVVAAKLAELAGRVARLRERRPRTPEALTADRDLLEIVSFNLMLAVQACLDVASHLISDEGWRPATSLSGAFARLAEQGVLTADVAAAMGRAPGLRNVVAHLYADVDPRLVHVAAHDGLEDLERFAAQIAAWTSGRGSPRR